MTTGELIRATRELKGMTQREVGEKCGIAEPTIRRYELGKLRPKYGTVQKIAAVLGVPASYLLQSEKCYISQDLQELLLDKIKERIDGELAFVDPADLYEVFGTYDSDAVFPDVYDGKNPLTKDRVEEIADSLGVSFDYLIGFTDNPSDEGDNINGEHSEG